MTRICFLEEIKVVIVSSAESRTLYGIASKVIRDFGIPTNSPVETNLFFHNNLYRGLQTFLKVDYPNFTSKEETLFF